MSKRTNIAASSLLSFSDKLVAMEALLPYKYCCSSSFTPNMNDVKCYLDIILSLKHDNWPWDQTSSIKNRKSTNLKCSGLHLN